LGKWLPFLKLGHQDIIVMVGYVIGHENLFDCVHVKKIVLSELKNVRTNAVESCLL